MFKVLKVWLVALGVLLFGQSAFAIDYYWGYSGKNLGSSPSAACQAWADSFNYVDVYVEQMISATQAKCKAWRSDYYTYYTMMVYRYGDGCPAGTEYNSTTGTCDAPEQSICEQAQGSSTRYWVQTQLDADPPDKVDVNGCLATFGGVISCRNTTDGTGVCVGTATITGEETPASAPVAGTGTDCSGAECQPPYPQTESSELPCEPTTDPDTGASVCTSESHFSEPGTSTCGTANGKLVCSENPKSRSQDKVTETSTETTTNPDGSTSTTTTTTTSKTDCVGIGGCTSTTSSETTSGGTNSDGSAKPESSSCVGDGCAAPEDLPGDEPGAGLPSGDLKQPAERGNFADEIAEMDQAIADSRADLRGKLDQMAELVTAHTQLSLSDGGGQLFCQTVPIAALGSSIDICFSEYEDELANLRWIILFLAAVLAFYIIFLR